MSATTTSEFGMTYGAGNDDVRAHFDSQFEKVIDELEAWSVPSVGCTGSCVCCSNGCDSCF